jgi:starch phosphorylase
LVNIKIHPSALAPTPSDALEAEVDYCLRYWIGKDPQSATPQDVYKALAYALRPRLMAGLEQSEKRYESAFSKRLYYLSAEFLIGQSLRNNLFNLDLSDAAQEVCRSFGFELKEVENSEPDASLGNGGLGRLAACFLESLASMDLPGFGYGINYEFGLFKQEIHRGYQQEHPDQWLREPSPWEIGRMDEACVIPLYGRIENSQDHNGRYNPMWVDWKFVLGVPYDIPIAGYHGHTVNKLRLYSARASDEFDIQVFNGGDYLKAVEAKIQSETISKVLYPSDSSQSGKELRLVQEYFMVACALRDILGQFLRRTTDLETFPQKVAIQMNDTHPALAVAELMRLLVDEHSVPWNSAWEITRNSCAFTNHTLMPEALEKWPVDLLEKVLPRHLQIMYEINQRFLQEVECRFPGDVARRSRMSMIEESMPRQVRMAHLAIIGSHAVNGVAKLHSELVKKILVPDFYALWPDRFTNVTNGVTHRRWLACANPALSSFITKFVGSGWETDFQRIRELEKYASAPHTQRDFLAIKHACKVKLSNSIYKEIHLQVDPESMFDVHVKRIHEYKRQLLNVLRVIHVYKSIIEEGKMPRVPRTVIFGGKAAPGYHIAKLIIKLINSVAEVINRDPKVKGMLKVAFLPNYRVSLAEVIIPGTDLSEQISTAGTEASGTSNMKFAMNGALTIGTLDGANIEIREQVGADNFYLFGLDTDQVAVTRKHHNPRQLFDSDADIRGVIDYLVSGKFSFNDPGIFGDICAVLLDRGDHYLHLADFHSYLDAHARVEEDYLNRSLWGQKALLNVARSCEFTSDQSIGHYAKRIWNIVPAID